MSRIASQIAVDDPGLVAGSVAPEATAVDLARFNNRWYRPGRGRIVRVLWYLIGLALFESGWFPFSRPKRALLRLFGARIGKGVVLKPHLRIKYPWRLVVGDHCWIGEDAWIDNLAEVRIGSNVCISQQVYLCTGSHDHCSRAFDLITKPIEIGDGAWLAARSLVLGGVVIGAGAVVAAGSVVTSDVEPAVVVAGQPTRRIADRRIQ